MSQVGLAVLSAVSALLAFGVGGYVRYYTSSPPSRPFALSTFAGGVWAAVIVVFPLTSDRQLLEVAGSVASVAATWVVVYFFVFVSVYTATDLVGERRLRALKYVGVAFSLLWAADAVVPVLQTAPRIETVKGITYPVTEPLPLFVAYIGVIYALVLGSLGLLLRFLRDDGNLYKTETAVFIAIVIVGFGSNVAFRIGLAPHPGLDITPMSYTVQAALSSYVLFSRDFLDLDRIASEIVIEEITDPVVVLNEARQVIKANGEATTVFGPDRELVDAPTAAVLPAAALETEPGQLYAHPPDADDPDRQFVVNTVPVTDQYDRRKGEILVFRDVTEQERARKRIKAQQTELEFYRQIISRVLRHNIRTETNVIRGNAEIIRSRASDGGPIEEAAATIAAATDRLQGVSENARELGTVIEHREDVSTVDLVEVVDGAVETVREAFEDAAITVDAPPNCPAETVPGVRPAITNIVENAVEYGGSEPSVTVRVRDDPPTVRVEDDGPGVPEQEIRTIESAEETDLQHGSGAGLWLAERVASYSDGSIEIENTDDGAVVTMTFSAAD